MFGFASNWSALPLVGCIIISHHMMDQLKEYRKVVKIHCLEAPANNSGSYSFEVKFEQINPHRIFKFVLAKTRDELMRLYERLEYEIFDFENPFHQSFFGNLTKPNVKPVDVINESLEECTQRIDVLTHHHFISFFCIHIHYPDFLNCLKEEAMGAGSQQENAPVVKKEYNAGLKNQMPWIKSKQIQAEIKPMHQPGEKEKPSVPVREEAKFQTMINMVHAKGDYQLQTQEKAIVDFLVITYFQQEFVIVLQSCKKTTKISNIFKTFFSDPKPFAYVSIHKKQGGVYKRKFNSELQAEPKYIEYNPKTNMVMVLTSVGVFVYLIKMAQNTEAFEIFTFIQLVGVSSYANNCFFGQIYMVRSTAPFKLCVYSLKDEKLMDTEYKFKNAKSVCFEEHHSRLYVSDQIGVFVYFVDGGVDIKKLHCLKMEENFINMSIKLGYLYCINGSGQLIVIELKPPQKQQLMSITTKISIPAEANHIVGSKNQRLIISSYKDCIVLIDTIEGPINSHRTKQGDLKSLFYDSDKETLMCMTETGRLTTFKISKQIQ